MEYGYVVGDRYIIRKKLGKGSGGSVFMAYDSKLDKCWAVKMCNGFSGHETEALKKIDYYAFPRIVDVIHQDEKDFLIMDYIEGTTLDKYVRKHRMNERQILRMGRKIAEGMNYLHNQSPAMLYMDCKPENIIVTPSGDIRLIDLGSVYVCEEEKDNIISGTAFYAAVEVKEFGLHKYEKPDLRSDIYSFGMTMYYLMTGSKTEYRDRKGRLCLRRQNKNISAMTEKIVQRCTLSKMKDRYQNMQDVLEDLNIASGKAMGRIRGGVQPLIMRITDVLCKCILCFGALIYAYRFNLSMEKNHMWICSILLAVFLLMSRKRSIYSWENKKDIFRGAGARALMSILVIASAFSGVDISAASYKEHKETVLNTISQDKMENKLGVILYDEYGRKMLIRPGAVWELEKDIKMTIPVEEISENDCKITVCCEEGEKQRIYTFLCRKNTDSTSK